MLLYRYNLTFCGLRMTVEKDQHVATRDVGTTDARLYEALALRRPQNLHLAQLVKVVVQLSAEMFLFFKHIELIISSLSFIIT